MYNSYTINKYSDVLLNNIKKIMKIWIIWTWYVWLIQAVWLAKLWFEVISLDIDESKIKQLNGWIPTIYENWLEDLLKEVKNNITFTSNYKDLDNCDVIFVAVGTPQDKRWRTNKEFIHKVSITIKQVLNPWKIVVIKSTVPVGTNKEVSEILWKWFDVVSNPEFLREWKAIDDFFSPDRVVVGFSKNVRDEVKEKMRKVYNYFIEKDIAYIETDWQTAELIKYAANSFLATKISFINELSQLADKVWADIETLSKWMWLDNRIWKSFLNAGLWYGGSCFPKDVKSLIHQFKENWLKWEVVDIVDKANENQLEYFLWKIENFYDDLNWKKLLLLWLAFKPHTDDLRESRAIELAKKLNEKQVKIYWYDLLEKARENTKEFYPDMMEIVNNLDTFNFKNIDWIVIATEYQEFNNLDWDKIKEDVSMPVIFDGRNILDKKMLNEKWFIYKWI